MKKHILSIAILTLISASSVVAQTIEQQTAKIRNLYAAINKRIDEGLKDKTSGLHHAAWTIGGESDGQQWSAVGTMETRDEIWFDGEPDPESETSNKASDVRKLVRKIISSYKGAADLHSRTEYLFDERGELVFVYSSDDTISENGKTLERRFYFARGKLIRFNLGGQNTDAKFSAEVLAKAKEVITEAAKLQNIFALMFAE